MADTEPSEAHAHPDDSQVSSIEGRSTLRKLLGYAIWPIGLIGWGATAWLLYSSSRTESPAAPVPPAPVEAVVPVAIEPSFIEPIESVPADDASEPTPSPPEPESVKVILERVDTYLAEGNPEAALVDLRGIDALSYDDQRSELLYRRGICLETIGELAEAESIYRALLDGSHAEQFSIAGRLGLCRTALHDQRPDHALSIATDLLFQTGSERLGTDVYGELVNVIAQARLAKALLTGSNNLLDDHFCLHTWPKLNPGYLLHLLKQGIPVATDHPNDEITAVFQQGKTPDTLLLRVHQPSRSIYELANELSQVGGFQLEWTGTTAATATRNSTAVQSPGMSLAALFDGLLEPLQLSWLFEAGRISIHDDTSMPDADYATARVASAQRALDEAISIDPDHPFAPYNYLGLGNLAFQRGDYRQASRSYDTLVKRYRDADCAGETWLNLGKSQMHLSNRTGAHRAFLQTADHSVGNPLEAVGYLYAGRILLEDGNAEEAIRLLRRAVPRASPPDIRGAAAVTLATAYLNTQNPHNANSVLMQDRAPLEQSPYRDSAVLVGAIARFDAAKDINVRMQHGRSLVTALAHVTPEHFFGLYGELVVGEACERVGMFDQMARLYEKALERPQPPELEKRLRFELADYWEEIGDRSRAIKTLEPLLTTKNELLGRTSRLKFAELLLAAQEYPRCRDTCLWLLAHPGNDAERRQTLKILGQAYQAQDDFENAARCFEGLVPPQDVNRVPKDVVPTQTNESPMIPSTSRTPIAPAREPRSTVR